ncbi:aminoglycoside phosphotransferase family protein [Roseovarius sp. C7]|uniref:aminoglycoside phosphotransferase family protein n=1 Tax=Roseovarius sp. C7 TaxID=3398643 RepID=UPI0039F694C3
MSARPEIENSLYSAATDVLLALHQHPPPADLASYDVPLMADMAALAHDWYASGLGRDTAAARTRLHGAMRDALTPLQGLDEVLIQRDYHAENLLWMPERDGLARVGLLDFQDAMRGHRAYDLVSLLQDARRDVSPETEAAMIARYLDGWDGDRDAFTAAYRALGAQRNLRIIGVFARLCLRDGKPHYLDFLPRVWGYLMRDLDTPALTALREAVTDILPPPDSDALHKLRTQCSSM